jgi:predicted TIM-barrel fold metal-dependent hydrolase
MDEAVSDERPADGRASIRERVRLGQSLAGEVIVDTHAHLGSHGLTHVAYKSDADVVAHFDRLGPTIAYISAYVSAYSDNAYGNDEMARLTAAYPRNFVGCVMVHPHLDVMGELERGWSMGLRGLKLIPAAQNYPNDGDRFDQAFEFAAAHRMVIMNHRWLNPARLLERGRSFPDATFLMGHMLWDYDDFVPVLRACDNVFLTTTSSHRFRGIEAMVRQVGAHKLVFGSDASYHELAYGLGTIAFARIADDQKRQILGLNMRAIMQDNGTWPTDAPALASKGVP